MEDESKDIINKGLDILFKYKHSWIFFSQTQSDDNTEEGDGNINEKKQKQ